MSPKGTSVCQRDKDCMKAGSRGSGWHFLTPWRPENAAAVSLADFVMRSWKKLRKLCPISPSSRQVAFSSSSLVTCVIIDGEWSIRSVTQGTRTLLLCKSSSEELWQNNYLYFATPCLQTRILSVKVKNRSKSRQKEPCRTEPVQTAKS